MRGRFIVFICILISSSVYAEDINLEHFSNEDGLSHNSIRHIVQDKTGLLWLGTFGGVNSFDGYKFTSYLSNSRAGNSIRNNDITAMEIDYESDQMWIGTRNGLTQYNFKTHQFKTFLPEKNNPHSICDSEIRSIYIDKYKRVWVGTKTQGLCIYDPKSESFSKVENFGFDYIKSIFKDENGSIWIGSDHKGLAKISLNSTRTISNIKTYNLPFADSNEINPYVNFIYQDDKSDLFVGTREGLYILDKYEDKFVVLQIPDNSVRDILGPYFNCVTRAPNGRYWLGTLGGLIVCDHLEDIAKGKFQWHYSVWSEETSLVDNLVSALFFDNSGILWIGTENGLDKYDPFKNQFKTSKDISLFIGDKIPRISGFAQTYDDQLIVSTHDNGLFLDKNREFSILQDKYKEISSIYSSDGKIFYCGLWSGDILVYNYITKSVKLIDVGFDEVPVMAFCMLKNGKLFVGSHGDGAVLLNPKNSTVDLKCKDLLDNIEIYNAVSNTGGIIWLATGTGVIRYDPIKNEAVTYVHSEEESKGLSISDVRDISIDNKGKIWVVTTVGLNYYDPLLNDFVPVVSPEELHNNWITDIKLGENGELWLNFNNDRVGRFNPATNKLNIYHVGSGNRLDIFSNKGFLLFNDSLVYLTGKNGIIYFSTNELSDNLISDPPFITEVKVNNKEIFPGDTINGQIVLDQDINYSRRIELDYDNRNFSFSFSSPSYVNVRLNKYQYMLEGFDKEWVTVSNNSRNIQYTNLYPQEYVFKIRAGNSSGYWSNVSSYQVVIYPPFWLTYKAILLFLVILSFVVYQVQKQLKNRRLLKQELLLEKVKRERDEKLNNEKLRFFTNISHELRTPISLIIGPAKQLEEEGGGTDYQKSRVNLILRNSNRLLYLVNQLLDFRKAQTGELKLKVSKTDILLYTRNTFNSFEGFAKDKKINLNLICEYEKIAGWIDRDKYDKILYNLLSNAIKFTGKYGNVDLFVGLKETNPRILVLEVSDDGIGIPLESQKKIFSRFYQVEHSREENTGSGIGLSLVQSLVQLHKATIEVQSFPDKGSVFVVAIPIDREFYEDQEVFDYESKPIGNQEVIMPEVKKVIQSTELKEKILVIEDNKELRNFIAEYLSDYYKVYEAENGEEGLRVCRQMKPILCVADVMMPVMDGFQFCEELKNDESISHIPVILLTALSGNENKIKGYKLGADGYLVKPFDPSLLKSRIDNIVKARAELKGKFSEDVDSDVNVLTHSPIDEEFMTKLTGFIENKMSEPELTASLLCLEMGMSSSKLYRKVKELTDLAPNEFIRTIRLKKSAYLLKSKRHNVSEVATLVGFNDPLYFSRCFKKQFGFPPSNLLQ
ncbi:two-component regulator propeller domain-containing protein [Labilibaculum manganireducens]|uniref:hybrid sensor histidine kinase/response regulator transcription factor n=1 Tax=Labilibaculum manganireducens TaxID=1940525 RepID=UPI0029F54D7C|nr:two-component regulator propeller domain-containing protein [Labilibaculum manganireducens]